MKMRLASVLLITAFSTMPVSAGPSDWSAPRVHVTYIEMKVGNGFRFMVDQQAGPCAPNTMLLFDARFFDPSTQADMVKTVYATVLATKLSGQTLHITGDNTVTSAGCVVGIVDSDQ